MFTLVSVNRIERKMTDFPRAEIQLIADVNVRDRFKLSIRNPQITLDAARGCIHVLLDCGDLSNLSHDILVARFEDDEQSDKLRTA